MPNKEDREDGDEPDVTAAAKFRQWMMGNVRRKPSPINQSIIELEHLGEHYGISGIVDFDDDFDDIDDLGVF